MKKFTFTTKFNVGDKVVFFDIEEKKINEGEIVKIICYVTNSGIQIWYMLGNDKLIRDTDAYASREEFISQL